jgi:hypothetical protein
MNKSPKEFSKWQKAAFWLFVFAVLLGESVLSCIWDRASWAEQRLDGIEAELLQESTGFVRALSDKGFFSAANKSSKEEFKTKFEQLDDELKQVSTWTMLLPGKQRRRIDNLQVKVTSRLKAFLVDDNLYKIVYAIDHETSEVMKIQSEAESVAPQNSSASFKQSLLKRAEDIRAQYKRFDDEFDKVRAQIDDLPEDQKDLFLRQIESCRRRIKLETGLLDGFKDKVN